jgi:ABC-2 type transport system permease protein
MAAFVLSAVAVRFVFPAVSAEGPAFWIVRTSPLPMRALLWGKFWTGLVPILALAELLTVVSNQLLGVVPFIKVLSAVAIAFMSVALVGMAAGLGARYPRFGAENLTQVAGSYGGVAFMVLAVLFIIAEIVLLGWPTSVYLWHQYRSLPVTAPHAWAMAASFAAAAGLSLAAFWISMRRGVEALDSLGD